MANCIAQAPYDLVADKSSFGNTLGYQKALPRL